MPFLATRRKKQRFGCLLGPACSTPSSYPSITSCLSVRWKGPRDAGAAAASGQLPAFRLRPIHLKRVDESASEEEDLF